MTVDDGADRKYLELASEVRDNGDQGTSGSEGDGQDGSQHDADDAQRESIKVRGDDLGDAGERTAVLEIPPTDRVVPTLDRTSTMASDNHETDDDADYEDRYGDPGEDQSSMQNSAGFTDSPTERLKVRGGCLCRWHPQIIS